MSEQRRQRLRLEISREAARMFWEDGVAATSGDRIAAAVGLSTRTLWRHFRTKESCAEPIVAKGVSWVTDLLRRWPADVSLEDHVTAEGRRYVRETADADAADDVLAMKMVVLSTREPALRTAWLMACDQSEHDMAAIIAARLRLPPDDRRVRLHAAAASAAMRVTNEWVGAALLAGADPRDFADTPHLVAHAVRTATGGALGDAIPA
ncbi:TetR/AcrR family transcriptional regulator [Streptomyces sp. NPDC054784]